MTRGRIALVLGLATFLVIWLVGDFGWATLALVVGVVLYAFMRAAGFLAEGQREWFGREQERRERRP